MQALKTDPAHTATSSSPYLSSTATPSVPVSADSPFEPSPTPGVVASGADDLLPPAAPADALPAAQATDLQAESPVPNEERPDSSPQPAAPIAADTTAPIAEATPEPHSPSPEATATTAATTAATATPATTTSAAPTEQVVIIPPTLPVLTHEERWRSQQLDREVFDTQRQYTTNGSQLWWFDPVNQQHIILGNFVGDFQAQASFTLRGQATPALEVPYKINESYGLTSVSSVLVDRMHQAGYTDWIETYVFVTPNVEPR
jgi:hypothetical protein